MIFADRCPRWLCGLNLKISILNIRQVSSLLKQRVYKFRSREMKKFCPWMRPTHKLYRNFEFSLPATKVLFSQQLCRRKISVVLEFCLLTLVSSSPYIFFCLLLFNLFLSLKFSSLSLVEFNLHNHNLYLYIVSWRVTMRKLMSQFSVTI